MSHLPRAALHGFGALALIAASACSSSKPAPNSPEQPSEEGPAEPAAAPASEAPEPSADGGGPALDAPAGAEPVTRTLLVGAELADCQGEAPMKCLQVREKEGEEWRNLYAPIEGFQHEASHAYELRVEIIPVANPPADGSSLRYRLVEVISKQKVPAPAGD